MKKLYKLKKIILKKKADSIFLTNNHPNHYWLLEKKVNNSILIVRKKGKPILFKTALENFNSKYFKVIEIETNKQLEKEIKKINMKKTCIDEKYLVQAHKKILRGITLINASTELEDVRAIKTKKEITYLKKANKLTAECFNEIIKHWEKFRHENDVIKFIKHFAIEHDCELAFNPIIASGKNAAIPHHSENTKLKRGFCIIDFGFEYKGYKADMTRTLYLGNPTTKEVKIYNELLKIQEKLIKMSLPGTKAKEIDKTARIMLGKKEKLFIHSLGHGTGLEIHEAPNIGPGSKDILKENMIITIEPGIYKKNSYGIRIEDSIIVKKRSPEIITKKATKKLIIKPLNNF